MLASALAQVVDNLLSVQGDTTVVNGVTISGALWAMAQAGRTQAFLQDDLAGKPAYEVTLPRQVLGVPWNLRAGSAVARPSLGWRGSVVGIQADGLGDEAAVVHALVLLSSGL